MMLVAAGLSALGRIAPGTRRAATEIALHLERDPDR